MGEVPVCEAVADGTAADGVPAGAAPGVPEPFPPALASCETSCETFAGACSEASCSACRRLLSVMR